MIEKINFIKRLQSKHHFRISLIKSILKDRDRGRDVEKLIEISEIIFGQEDTVQMGKEEFYKATELTASQVDTALSLQLLVLKKQKVIDSEDIAVGRMLVEGGKEGIKIKELDFYPRFASEIVERKM